MLIKVTLSRVSLN